MLDRPTNVYSLNALLSAAERGGYAVGSFAPRSTAMIVPILQAAQALQSPVIVQISHKELLRHQVSPQQIADTFYAVIAAHNITIPAVLHLDHTKTVEPIHDAIDAGFTSVMMDASEKSFEENVALSREIVEYAHPLGISVEAELGRIGTTDFVETDSDEELYTNPEEAGQFVRETGVDALAVSVGTAHGVYVVRQPKIDFERLRAIREQTDVHLVLHGGSGVPPEMMQGAVHIPGGGVSKVNVATDLEIAMLAALNREPDNHFMNVELSALPDHQLQLARQAVERVVRDKIQNFVKSHAQAAAFSTSTTNAN